jgi:hypothetical protein
MYDDQQQYGPGDFLQEMGQDPALQFVLNAAKEYGPSVLGALNKPGDLFRAGLVGDSQQQGFPQLAENIYHNVGSAYQNTDASQPWYSRLGEAIDTGAAPYEKLQQDLRENDPTGGYVGGAINAGLDVATDPFSYTPGGVGKAVIGGGILGGLGGGALSASGLLGDVNPATAVETGAAVGQGIGGLEGLGRHVPALRGMYEALDNPNTLLTTFGSRPATNMADMLADLVGFRGKNAENVALDVSHPGRAGFAYQIPVPEGSPEAPVRAAMRKSAETGPDFYPDLSVDDWRQIPNSPGTGTTNNLRGTPVSSADSFKSINAGMEGSTAYPDYGYILDQTFGPNNRKEAAVVTAITSAQTDLKDNIATANWIGAKMREYAAEGMPADRNLILKRLREDKYLQGFGKKNHPDRPGPGDSPELGMFSGSKIPKIVDAYLTGTAKTGGAKTSTFAGNIYDAAVGAPAHGGTMDVHELSRQGYSKPDAAGGKDATYRAANERLAGEAARLGLPTDDVQAAGWYAWRNLLPKALRKAVEAGTETLGSAIDKAMAPVSEGGLAR